MDTWFTTRRLRYSFTSSLVCMRKSSTSNLSVKIGRKLFVTLFCNCLLYLVNAILCLQSDFNMRQNCCLLLRPRPVMLQQASLDCAIGIKSNNIQMKVIDHLNSGKSTLVSFEILPPLKGRSINALWEHLDPLMEFKPSFINVTYHRSESMFKRKADGTFEKVEVRKRPGTVGICAALMNRYKVDAVAHLICGGFTKQETEDALIDLHFLGVNNVLVLRGDAPKNEAFFEPEPGGHKYAIELLQQVTNMNNGIYLEEDLKNAVKTDFCIGVAGYPEKHFESPNMQTDLAFLKAKVDAGAEYVTTQMFFDNQKYFAFVECCRKAGINVPIIPGLKPISSKKQLNIIPRTFHVDIPEQLYNEIQKCKTDADVEIVGTEWLLQQSKELKAAGVPLLHYYTLGKPHMVANVVKEII